MGSFLNEWHRERERGTKNERRNSMPLNSAPKHRTSSEGRPISFRGALFQFGSMVSTGVAIELFFWLCFSFRRSLALVYLFLFIFRFLSFHFPFLLFLCFFSFSFSFFFF
jgi:hypothetical protein